LHGNPCPVQKQNGCRASPVPCAERGKGKRRTAGVHADAPQPGNVGCEGVPGHSDNSGRHGPVPRMPPDRPPAHPPPASLARDPTRPEPKMRSGQVSRQPRRSPKRSKASKRGELPCS
jgi:hypothetical protein